MDKYELLMSKLNSQLLLTQKMEIYKKQVCFLFEEYKVNIIIGDPSSNYLKLSIFLNTPYPPLFPKGFNIDGNYFNDTLNKNSSTIVHLFYCDNEFLININDIYRERLKVIKVDNQLSSLILNKDRTYEKLNILELEREINNNSDIDNNNLLSLNIDGSTQSATAYHKKDHKINSKKIKLGTTKLNKNTLNLTKEIIDNLINLKTKHKSQYAYVAIENNKLHIKINTHPEEKNELEIMDNNYQPQQKTDNLEVNKKTSQYVLFTYNFNNFKQELISHFKTHKKLSVIIIINIKEEKLTIKNTSEEELFTKSDDIINVNSENILDDTICFKLNKKQTTQLIKRKYNSYCDFFIYKNIDKGVWIIDIKKENTYIYKETLLQKITKKEAQQETPKATNTLIKNKQLSLFD